ncbi:hypothetical protein BDP27DRAFT_1432383 [Rhodocollybia butyracea]|uniref:Uncharacterized protein n=1 Tax=Rhodocollybia butyracea TaxID=206335 RepID=A0A9P5PAI2_9AGAR|nr:hypothetical protein BDP27DRAFT_1432383 [Rhodocollybia butyracea]
MDQTLLKQDIIEVAFGMGVWGINTSLVALTMYSLISRGLMASRSRQVLLAVVFCMYFGDCVSEVVYILKFIAEINNLGGPPLPPIQPGPQYFCLDIFTRINFLLSDGVVCWRAWVLYPRNKKARGLLVFCMLGSVTAIVTALVIQTQQLDKAKSGSLTTISNLTYYVPLLFTNVVATILVGARFWEYRTQILDQVYSGRPERTSPVNRVLVLLTESGIIYCFFWILSMLSSVAIMGNFAAEIFECVLPQLSCIYLSTVILVSLQKSFDINTVFSGQSGLEVETHMNFAKPPSDSQRTVEMPRIGVSFCG